MKTSVIVVVLIVLGVVATGAGILAGVANTESDPADPSGASESDSASASASPRPSDEQADPSQEPVESGSLEERADSAVSDFLVAAAEQIGAEDGVDLEALSEVARGAMLNELEAESLELQETGWTRSGVPTIVWTKLATSEPDGAVSIQACLDSSSVTVEAEDGAMIAPSITPRAINIFTLSSIDGALRVVARSFPDNPEC